MTFSGDWAATQLLDCCLLTYFKICKVFHNSTTIQPNPFPACLYKCFGQNKPTSSYSTCLNIIVGGEILM